MTRPLLATLVLGLLAGPAPLRAEPSPAVSTVPVAPSPYLAPGALRADAAAVGPDPFAWAPAGTSPAPTRPDGPVPDNVAHLSLARPFTLAALPPGSSVAGLLPVLPPPTAHAPGAAVIRLPLAVRNPFLADAPAPPEPPAVPSEAAADPYQAWLITLEGSAWDALDAAWTRDPVAVRRMFREAAGQDWPVTSAAGPRAEANRLAAVRWIRERWEEALRARLASMRQSLALRGPVIVQGTPDALLSFVAAGDTAAPGIAVAPRVTADPWVNRYGVGFLVRLAADLSERIPWPALDLSGIGADEAPWAVHGLDEAVRQGVQGMFLTPPRDASAARTVRTALQPLSEPNVYLPPPSEVGILVSRDTAALEAGAWVATFRAYAALREAGLWPSFVSDEQVLSGRVSLARFDVLVVPAAKWADRDLLDSIRAWTRRGGTIVVTDPFAFARARDGWDTSGRARDFLGWASAEPRGADPAGPETGPVRIVPAEGTRVLATFPDEAPALTDRRIEHGRVLAAALPLVAPQADWSPFWREVARAAGVPSRPWLDRVTTANVEKISGTYRRPAGP